MRFAGICVKIDRLTRFLYSKNPGNFAKNSQTKSNKFSGNLLKFRNFSIKLSLFRAESPQNVRRTKSRKREDPAGRVPCREFPFRGNLYSTRFADFFHTSRTILQKKPENLKGFLKNFWILAGSFSLGFPDFLPYEKGANTSCFAHNPAKRTKKRLPFYKQLVIIIKPSGDLSTRTVL